MSSAFHSSKETHPKTTEADANDLRRNAADNNPHGVARQQERALLFECQEKGAGKSSKRAESLSNNVGQFTNANSGIAKEFEVPAFAGFQANANVNLMRLEEFSMRYWLSLKFFALITSVFSDICGILSQFQPLSTSD